MKIKIVVIILITSLVGVGLIHVLRADTTQPTGSGVMAETLLKTPVAAASPEKPAAAGDDPAQEVGLDSANAGDDLDIKVLRDQMSKERDIQQQIKLRSLELERAKLQLEQEKALAEMHQLRKINQGVLRDPSGDGTTTLPDIKAVFLGAGKKFSTAIISINGTNFTVKEGDAPQENVIVKGINEKCITVMVNGNKELSLTPGLME